MSRAGAAKPTRDMERFSSKQRTFCKSAVRAILADENSVNFASPVGELWDLDDLPDYAEKVPHPMDLGTVLSGLEDKRRYAAPNGLFVVAEFVVDVERTFTNAMDYNDAGTDMYNIAEAFLTWFRDFMKDLPTEFKSSSGHVRAREREAAAASASEAERSGADDAEDAGDGGEDETEGGGGGGGGGGVSSDGGRVKAEAADGGALRARAAALRAERAELQKRAGGDAPLSGRDRMRLRDEVERLPWARCETVVEILRDSVDAALAASEEESPAFVDIDLDTVEPGKLREVWAFLWGDDGGDAAAGLARVDRELAAVEAKLGVGRKRPRDRSRDRDRDRRRRRRW
jgi:Bromodomain